jgi:hypothetical protein
VAFLAVFWHKLAQMRLLRGAAGRSLACFALVLAGCFGDGPTIGGPHPLPPKDGSGVIDVPGIPNPPLSAGNAGAGAIPTTPNTGAGGGMSAPNNSAGSYSEGSAGRASAGDDAGIRDCVKDAAKSGDADAPLCEDDGGNASPSAP